LIYDWFSAKYADLGDDELIILVDYKNPFDLGKGPVLTGKYTFLNTFKSSQNQLIQ